MFFLKGRGFFPCYYKSNLSHGNKQDKKTEILPSSPPGRSQAEPWANVPPRHTHLPLQSPGSPGRWGSCHETELPVWESGLRPALRGFCVSLGRTCLSGRGCGDDLEGPFALAFRNPALSGRVQKAGQTQGLLSYRTNESGTRLTRGGSPQHPVTRGNLETRGGGVGKLPPSSSFEQTGSLQDDSGVSCVPVRTSFTGV